VSSAPESCKSEDRSVVWEEYKYRHDLCWRLVLQTTLAVVALHAVPYVNREVTLELGVAVVMVPIIGVILSGFAWLRLRSEHALLDRIRHQHRTLNPDLYGDGAPLSKAEQSTFKLHSDVYLGSLVLLGCANIVVIVTLWVPGVT
jgi:hypothetical protein